VRDREAACFSCSANAVARCLNSSSLLFTNA
jgi:hypothetical protein